MLPMWIRGNRPITVPLGRRTITCAYPLPVLLLLILVYLLFSSWPRATHLPSGRTVSPFLVPSSDLLPAPSLVPPHFIPEPVPPKAEGMVVPNAVHYVYGLKPPKEGETGEEMPYYAYLAVRSAMLRIKPDKIFFHYKYMPTGPWWDLLLPELTLVETESPDSIMGRKITHFAHKADVLRLLAMKHSGGIYLDIDMFVTKSFDDLMYFPTTLAMEEATESYRGDMDPQGLCNAVIVAAPHSDFIDRWLASYETFDETQWNHHSVVQPWILARRYPDSIQVLNHRAMFWPMWYGDEVDKVHDRDDWDFYGSGQYAYHAWESLAMKWLKHLSPASIRGKDTSFHRLLRPLIGPEDDVVYAKWRPM